ncbi:MAG: polymer-forming cytoskeletal protein [Steroidobacteraceae bacterium]|jgi:cytoskeletal protein CcmA (bactofilin family)
MTEEIKNPPAATAAAGKRRFLDRSASTPTVIGAGSVFIGNMRGFGPFVISGAVQGDGELLGDLSLAVGATWLGNIRAQRAIVAGQIVGSLEVEDKLEIGRTAVIRGRVSARTVAIAQGAIVDGDIDVTSGDPVVQFEEKRDR